MNFCLFEVVDHLFRFRSDKAALEAKVAKKKKEAEDKAKADKAAMDAAASKSAYKPKRKKDDEEEI